MEIKKTVRRMIASAVLVGMLPLTILPLTSCAHKSLYTATFFGIFDTVVTLKVVSAHPTDAQAAVNRIKTKLETLDRQFDIYKDAAGENNLKTINDTAGSGQPIAVSQDILELLMLGQALYTLSEGRVNICMGAVLSLWHEAREAGDHLPDPEALDQAADHIAIESLLLNRETGTAYLSDPDASLDVGAIAKGYAAASVTELCRPYLAEGRISGILLELGGHVLALGQNTDGQAWQVGIRDPRDDAVDVLDTLSVTDASVVTSGVDQRNFVLDGVIYHHLIDPATLFPGTQYLSVTISIPDGQPLMVDGVIYDSTALADGLSTALFLMTPEEGDALIRSIPGATVIRLPAP